MKVESHEFVIGESEPHTEREGKTHWDDQLMLRMNRFDAWHMVEFIQRQLRDADSLHVDAEDRPFVFYASGKLRHTGSDDI